MRKGTTFDVVHIVKKAGAFETDALPPQHQQHVLPSAATTGWKSPVPYLFGGLAAMLGLIAFALLILACSYWKLSGNFDDEEAGGEGEEKVKDLEMKTSAFENSILVIMAGEEKPTFLATPATSRTTSFGDSESKLSCSCSCSSSSSSSGDCSDSCGGDEEKKEVKLTTEFAGS